MINSREEIVLALQEAAELEQGLMVQYLYAALTLKNSVADGLTQAHATMVTSWRRTISTVARQEMGHLATVQNFLSTLGGAPHLSIPKFPIPAKFYHPSQVFSLEPLTPTCIDRFVHFEAPIGAPLVNFFALQPDPLDYKTVGDLYRQIESALTQAREAELFIGPSDGQDLTNWGSITVLPTRTATEAGKAVNHIIEEGEATTTGGVGSHYEKFLKIREQYRDALMTDPNFVPYRNVVSNPTTILAGTPGSTYLTDPDTRKVGEFFASAYQTLLLALSQYYKFQDKDNVPVPGIDPRGVLQSIAVGMMQLAIRPVGEDILPTLPAGVDGKFAGPCFEAYSSTSIPWDRNVVWHVLIERLTALKAAATELTHTNPAFADVAQSMSDLIDTATPIIP